MRNLATLVVRGGYSGHGRTGSDQDLLNAYFRKGFKQSKGRGGSSPSTSAHSAHLLDRSFNIRVMQTPAAPEQNATNILHFVSYPKPWSIVDEPGMIDPRVGRLPRDVLKRYKRLLANRNDSRFVSPYVLPRWSLELFYDINLRCAQRQRNTSSQRLAQRRVRG